MVSAREAGELGELDRVTHFAESVMPEVAG